MSAPDTLSQRISTIALDMMPDILIERAALLYARGFVTQADAIIESFVVDHLPQIDAAARREGLNLFAPPDVPLHVE